MNQSAEPETTVLRLVLVFLLVIIDMFCFFSGSTSGTKCDAGSGKPQR